MCWGGEEMTFYWMEFLLKLENNEITSKLRASHFWVLITFLYNGGKPFS